MREIAKSLSYEDKRHISIIHRNFDFRSTRDFRLIEKYSSFISNWETFKNDLYSDLEKNIVCCDPLKNVVLNLINYVGCKSVMGDLLFCNRLFEGERQCNQCTRMICFDHKHSQILSKNIKFISLLSRHNKGSYLDDHVSPSRFSVVLQIFYIESNY